MLLHLPTRLAALAALCLGVLGCGQSSVPPPGAQSAAHAHQSAPRPLPTPRDARPLIAIAPAGQPHLQASAASISPAPRIVEVRVTPEALARKTVRQPGAVTIREPAASPSLVREPAAQVARQPVAQPVREPPAEPAAPPAQASASPLRSPFFPQTAPELGHWPAALPQLPAVPNFATASAAPGGVQSGPYEIVPSLPPAPRPPPAAPPQFASTAPPTSLTPSPAAPSRGDPMQAVAQQAQAISDRGLAMAQRGMLFAGREETIKALHLVAQALDVQEGSSVHAAALSAGLIALHEARDFAPPSGQPGGVVDVAAIALAHRTPLYKDGSAAGVSPVVAQQQYLGHAQAQLVIAAGRQPAASLVLYRLGRLQTAFAAHDAAPHTLHAPQAMVFHQAALAIDGNNYLAANELGVLLARYGQLERARDLLVKSTSIRPQVESWHNLAVIHRRLGEVELAKQAGRERDLLARKAGGRTSSADLVQWVDTRAFASAGGDVSWPESKPAMAAAAAKPKRR